MFNRSVYLYILTGLVVRLICHVNVLYGIFGCMGCFQPFVVKMSGLINYP